jgi:16S rRNA processing protein RimM
VGVASLVRIGRLGRAHGVRGEIALDGADLTPLELHGIRSFVWRNNRGETRPLELQTARPADRRLLLKFAGVDDRDQAATLTLGELLAERDRLPDPGPGVVWTFQLLGLEVRTADGRRLGVLEDVVQTGAHPIYVVRGEKELLVPATPEVVQRVDLDAGVITVALPAGLEEIA